MRKIDELIYDIMKKPIKNLDEIKTLQDEVEEFMNSDASDEDKDNLKGHCESLAILQLLMEKKKHK